MVQRPYDVVLYGASGFTGRQTAHYFAAHTQPGQLRWAIAGRDERKLDAVKGSLGAHAGSVDVLVADGRDRAAVGAIVAQTRVLLTTAGPFSIYGDAIVDACAQLGTHYVDITGETAWVRDVITRHHERASASGTRIIPCCGFDSVPSDLGTLLAVRQLQRTHGVPCRSANAYIQMRSGLNGGTAASALTSQETGQGRAMADPFLLDPADSRYRRDRQQARDPIGPRFDPAVATWVAPFIMGRINTRVVRRSAALFDAWGEGYGPSFAYQEYQKLSPPAARLKAIAYSAGLAAFGLAFGTSVGRRLVKPFLPKPGTGPTEQAMRDGWFRCQMVAVGERGEEVRGQISFKGDPSNRATVTLLCESALCMALEFSALPGGPSRGGVLTPATGLGDALAERLRRAGMVITLDVAASPSR